MLNTIETLQEYFTCKLLPDNISSKVNVSYWRPCSEGVFLPASTAPMMPTSRHAIVALMPLLTSKLLGLNFIIHFTPTDVSCFQSLPSTFSFNIIQSLIGLRPWKPFQLCQFTYGVYFIQMPPLSGTVVNSQHMEGQWQAKKQEASTANVGREGIMFFLLLSFLPSVIHPEALLRINKCNNDTNTTVDFIGTFVWLDWSAHHFHQLLFTLNCTQFLHHQFTEVNLTINKHANNSKRTHTE